MDRQLLIRNIKAGALLPGAALAALVLIHALQGEAARELLPLQSVLPSIAALVVAIATIFGQGRMVLMALLVTATWAALLGEQALAPEVGPALLTITATLLPLNLGVYAFLPERGLFNAHGAWRSFVVAVQVILIWRLATQDAQGLVELAGTIGGLLPPGVATAIAVLLMLVALIVRGGPTEASFLAVLILLQPDLRGAPLPGAWLLSVVVLGVGLLQHTWELAFRDALTGLPDRRALDSRLRTLGSRFSIAMVDVDHFKRFNDSHGHDAGDQVLRMVASQLRGVAAGGKAYRYGGEEFCIVFGRDDEGVDAALEAVREEIRGYGFELRGGTRPKKGGKGARSGGGDEGVTVHVTVSMGLARRLPERHHPMAVVDAADRALYEAKRRGRNRLISAD